MVTGRVERFGSPDEGSLLYDMALTDYITNYESNRSVSDWDKFFRKHGTKLETKTRVGDSGTREAFADVDKTVGGLFASMATVPLAMLEDGVEAVVFIGGAYVAVKIGQKIAPQVKKLWDKAWGGKGAAPSAPKDVPGPGHNAANAARLAEDLRAAEMANPLTESLGKTGRLPPNYVTKAQADAAGWEPGKALNNKVPGGQLGGDVFRDPASIGLPTASGRIWYEADIGLSNKMTRAKQPGTRLLYSNDGKAFVTPDHYGRLYQLPDWK